MPQTLNRRQALGRLGAIGAGALGLARPAVAARARAPQEKLNLAIVGCGGQGLENLRKVAGENIVALCDVDDRRAAEAFQLHPKARRFRDYRKMLDALGRQIDAVVVSTPDHMHAPVSLAAMERGKHVYCEKPLTWAIGEARQMAKLARDKGLATQMGTQGMARDRSRAGIEVIRSGVLGKVTELHVWTDRPGGRWPQGIDRPRGKPGVPGGLDWGLWLGVAPGRPYNPAYCPFVWRGWKDFGTGAVGDMGIHNAAMPFAALRLGAPAAAEVIQAAELKAETFPAWSTLKVEFAARDGRGPVTLYWYDGGKKPPAGLIGGAQAGRQRGHRRRHEGDALLGGVDGGRLGPAAGRAVPRLPGAGAVAAAGAAAESPPGVAGGVPGRAGGLLPLRRVRLPADGGHAGCQPRPAPGPQDHLGRGEAGGARVPRSGPLHQAAVSDRLVRPGRQRGGPL